MSSNVIVEWSNIFSTFLTFALSGRTYDPDCLSGKMEVFQIVFLIVTETGSEPHPRAFLPKDSLIACPCFLGRVRKRHPAIPGYGQTFERIL